MSLRPLRMTLKAKIHMELAVCKPIQQIAIKPTPLVSGTVLGDMHMKKKELAVKSGSKQRSRSQTP